VPKTTAIRPREPERSHTQHFAGLAADSYGKADRRPPLVLLHGLTFDRRVWRPVLEELRTIDPRRRVLVLDLPGHGESEDRPSYDMVSVVEAVHQAVQEAGLGAPVIVGHSIAGVIASVYASQHPTRGVINVDQSLQLAPFAQLLQSLADKIRGPGFAAVWPMFAASFHTELLPQTAQDLVLANSHPRQEIVVGYWQEVFDRPIAELIGQSEAGLAVVKAAALPYLIVAGDDLEPGYRRWLEEVLPQATVIVWPRSGHFPHLAHPERFAKCLAATAQWSADAAREAASPLPRGSDEQNGR
jgi:pimeloyl-ACP methyl ester carboxylesterase